MNTKREFIEAWRKWQHIDFPNQNFRLRRTDAPTYKAELILDHLSNYVYALGSRVMVGDVADLKAAAYQYETELRDAENRLKGVYFIERSPYDAFISATRNPLACIGDMEDSS